MVIIRTKHKNYGLLSMYIIYKHLKATLVDIYTTKWAWHPSLIVLGLVLMSCNGYSGLIYKFMIRFLGWQGLESAYSHVMQWIHKQLMRL